MAGIENKGVSLAIKMSLQTRIQKMYPQENFSHLNISNFNEIPVVKILILIKFNNFKIFSLKFPEIFLQKIWEMVVLIIFLLLIPMVICNLVQSNKLFWNILLRKRDTQKVNIKYVFFMHKYIGVHQEQVPWHTIFGLLCVDIIFDHDIPFVWMSELQVNFDFIMNLKNYN